MKGQQLSRNVSTSVDVGTITQVESLQSLCADEYHFSAEDWEKMANLRNNTVYQTSIENVTADQNTNTINVVKKFFSRSNNTVLIISATYLVRYKNKLDPNMLSEIFKATEMEAMSKWFKEENMENFVPQNHRQLLEDDSSNGKESNWLVPFLGSKRKADNVEQKPSETKRSRVVNFVKSHIPYFSK